MNTYDRILTGDRIRSRRILLGMTQEELAEKIERVPKYCADIERGSCGMSLNTMISLASVLGMSLDYLILGKDISQIEEHQDETQAILAILNDCSEKDRRYALQLLKLFLSACRNKR